MMGCFWMKCWRNLNWCFCLLSHTPRSSITSGMKHFWKQTPAEVKCSSETNHWGLLFKKLKLSNFTTKNKDSLGRVQERCSDFHKSWFHWCWIILSNRPVSQSSAIGGGLSCLFVPPLLRKVWIWIRHMNKLWCFLRNISMDHSRSWTKWKYSS